MGDILEGLIEGSLAIGLQRNGQNVKWGFNNELPLLFVRILM